MVDDYLRGEAFKVEEANGQRWEAALSVLAKGGYVVWRGLGLTFRTQTVDEPLRVGSTLWVRVGTAWEPDHITSARAEAELRAAQGRIAELAANSKSFAELIASHSIVYELLYDYGMGAVRWATWTDKGFEYDGSD